MATELQPSNYSAGTQFYKIFSKMTQDMQGALHPVCAIKHIRETERYASAIATILFACEKEQTNLLLHLWSGKFFVDENLEIAAEAIVKSGFFVNFLDTENSFARDYFRLTYGAVQHARTRP